MQDFEGKTAVITGGASGIGLAMAELSAQQGMNIVLAAIRDRRFYLLCDEAWRDSANTRLDDLREGRNPTFAPPVSG